MGFPTVDLMRTGANIVRLRKAAGLTVHDLQMVFGFNFPQAIYKWQSGTALPTVDSILLCEIIKDALIHYGQYPPIALQHGGCLYPRPLCGRAGICGGGCRGFGDEPLSFHDHGDLHGLLRHLRRALRRERPRGLPPRALVIAFLWGVGDGRLQRTWTSSPAAAAAAYCDASAKALRYEMIELLD